MSLDFYLQDEERDHDCRCRECGNDHKYRCSPTLFSTNITHNLSGMFDEAGVYEILWRGDGMIAGEVEDKLAAALALMESDPERFKKHDSPNGWGLYIHAVPWLREIVAACREHKHAKIRCSR